METKIQLARRQLAEAQETLQRAEEEEREANKAFTEVTSVQLVKFGEDSGFDSKTGIIRVEVKQHHDKINIMAGSYYLVGLGSKGISHYTNIPTQYGFPMTGTQIYIRNA